MQKLFLGKSNRLWLTTEESIDAVTLSIVGPTGSFLEDSLDAALEEKTCTLDSSSGKYYLDVTLSSSATAADAYLVWEATLSGISVSLEAKNTPEDIVVVESISTDIMLASPTYVMDHFLRGISESEIEETFSGFSYRETVRDQIKAAHIELERLTQVYFTPTVITNEYHDHDMTALYEKYWTNRMFEFPIISVQEVRLQLKDQVIATLPEEWVQVGNPKQGMIKVIPFAGGASGFAFRLIMTLGANLSLIGGGVHYYPDFFVYDYTAGLDFDNLAAHDQLDIKNAIGRHVALNMLPNLDVNRGKSSESKSIDGASASISYTSSATFGEHSAALEAYKKAESKWIDAFKRKYLKRLIVDGYQ